MHALMISFRLAGLSADGYAQVGAELSPSIAALPGLLTKIWLTADDDRRAGLYLFRNADAADRFLGSALGRMVAQNPHFRDLTVQPFAVDERSTVRTQPHLRIVPAPAAV